ncbi:MAG: pre-peptidase C-terminal domain-containing protein [Verrucomicrobiales bacterium]|nr:pre-peptidase C-terminal domain-containing protein [Verrucomicrobiales bacterium]
MRSRSRGGRHLLTEPSVLAFAFLLLLLNPFGSFAQSVPDFAAVQAVFNQHCLDCHATQDPEAKLVLEDFETLMKGGESGAVLVPGKSDESLLVRMIEGKVERDGKKKIMPPGKRKKLETSEIDTLKQWIAAGARPPAQPLAKATEINVPKITPKVAPRRPVNALAYGPSPRLIAVGRYGEIELLSEESRQVTRTLTGHRGNVNAIVFSADNSTLFGAGGEAGLLGEVREWKVADGSLTRTIEGHRDAIYSLALSPDGKTLATGSYDQKIKLWNVQSGKELKTLSGHNGAIYSLAFRPDGKILASASADRTVKLWEVESGERRDTLSQALKEVYAVVFSRDGKRLFSAGADNRLRFYEVSEKAAETTNPLIEARFAHEGAIPKLVLSADGKTLLTSAEDRTVKLWDAATLAEKVSLERQPDWAISLAFARDDKTAAVGRLDGSLEFYEASNGKPMPMPKPELARAEPRGVQRSVATKIKLAGRNLFGLAEVKFSNDKLRGELLKEQSNSNETWISVKAASDLPRGSYELWLVSTNGESGKLKLHVDDVPQVASAKAVSGPQPLESLPVSVWATHEKPGDAEEFSFEAKAGQTITFDVAAKGLGSKSDLVLTLSDANGKVLASNNGFDGSTDPFLAHAFAADGRYTIRAHELLLGASSDHFYRLLIGAFPFVTGAYPLSVRAHAEAEVELVGYNLPPSPRVKIHATDPGEMELPLDPDKFRSRRAYKLIVNDGAELVESEPNGQPNEATKLSPPCAVGGRIWSASKSNDADLFQFDAKSGEQWIIETAAAQRGSPVDTRIEVLTADGKPVERVLLQAVRNSAVTFRGIDSTSPDCRVENWEEMELNQLLYFQGEVVKLFRAPQGPDSGFLFYMSNGKRRCYFDTTATAHAVDESCYIVETHPAGSKLVANGLPTFSVTYGNDDDGERKLGTDSKVHFTAPKDGSYLIRVTDTRGYSGERFIYRLVVRRPEPDFTVTLNGANPTVNPGSGQSFTVSVERKDGFEGEITVDTAGLPAGFSVSNPIVIQAGQTEARGTINAGADAPQPTEADASKGAVTASAMIEGRASLRAVNNFGRIKLGEKPRLYVGLVAGEKSGLVMPSSGTGQPLEITIAPGQTVPAWLKVKRNGHDDLITFTVDNLPHGVIVDNIGLNGVLIPKDQNEREIFFAAARWVPETDRLCFAVENQAGRQTSVPVLLKVRRAITTAAASARGGQ